MRNEAKCWQSAIIVRTLELLVHVCALAENGENSNKLLKINHVGVLGVKCR